jgi:transcription antitermination factor NusG
MSVNSGSPEAWFAVQVRPQYEKVVETSLAGKGYEVFLPMYRCVRRWSQRMKTLELPLFTGYLFSRFDVRARLPILVTPFVMRIVGIGRAPCPIDNKEIEDLHTVVASGLRAQPAPYVGVGQRVCIEEGSLAGVEGILVAWKGKSRILVSVELLQRAVSIEIDPTWVKPVTIRQAHPLGMQHSDAPGLLANGSRSQVGRSCG